MAYLFWLDPICSNKRELWIAKCDFMVLFFKCLWEFCTQLVYFQLETNWCRLRKVPWVRLRFVSYDATNMCQSCRRRHIELLGCRVGKCQKRWLQTMVSDWLALELDIQHAGSSVEMPIRNWRAVQPLQWVDVCWWLQLSCCSWNSSRRWEGIRGGSCVAWVWSLCLLPRVDEGRAHAPPLRLAQMWCCDFLPPACQQQGFIQILDFASTWILPSEISVAGKALAFPNFKRTEGNGIPHSSFVIK